MKNRIASLFLAFALLMSLCNFAVARDNLITVRSGGAERFTDVPADHWAYAYIDKVVGSGLFNGKTDTTFEPSNAMTRSQFVLVMDRMEGMNSLEGQYTVTKFPDVAPTRRAAGPIQWANEQGFVLGFGDGTFKPDSPITRGQFAALIHRYIIAKRYTQLHVVDPEPAQFTDADSVSNAFKDDVEYARVHGLLTGYSDGTVRASNPITRAAIAAILARFLDLVSESGYTPLLDGPVAPDNPDNPPVNVPTSYSKIKVSVTNAKHGETNMSSVLRNGVQVASDDVQPGDRVTFTHKPEDGYVAKITIKDSKGRDVPFTTTGNTTTFTAPENLPVNITVKYQKESSSSTSSGSGGNGNSSGSSTPTYWLKVSAVAADSVSGAPMQGVSVYLLEEEPGRGDLVSDLPEGAKVSNDKDVKSFHQTNKQEFNIYALFVWNDANTTFQSVRIGDTEQEVTDTNRIRDMKDGKNNDVFAYSVQVKANGKTSEKSADTINVTGYFKAGGQTIETTKDVKWTVAYEPADTNANYRFSAEKPTIPAQALTPSDHVLNVEIDNVKIDANSGELADKNNPPKVYFMISPKDGYDFDADLQAFLENGDLDDSVEVGETDADGTVRLYETNADGTVRLYKITKTKFDTKANETTNLKMTMNLANTRDLTHAVTVESYLGDKRIDNDPDNTKAVATSAPANNATEGNTVTVKVPSSPVFGGYKFVNAKAEGVTLPAPDENGNYTFTMPDNDVTVRVYYEEIPDNSLNYQVNVTFNGGSGKLPLNIAGTPLTVEGNTSYYVKLVGDAVTVTNDASKDDLKQSDYARLFDERADDKEQKLPIYFDGAVIPNSGYKLVSGPTADADVLNKPENTEDQYVLKPNEPINITVDFNKIKSYGYNLTVIGGYTVQVDFNGQPVSRAGNASTPQTYSTGLVVCENPPSLKVTLPSGFTLKDKKQHTYTNGPTDVEALKVTINGETKDYDYGTDISLADSVNKLVDVVVEFHKADRVAVPFTVKASGAGNVTVKPESGQILLVSEADASEAAVKTATDKLAGTVQLSDNEELKSSDKLTVTTQEKEATKSYYAYEDTIITLVPASGTQKVYSVAVTKDANNEDLQDVMNKAGFSFQLQAATTADVEFKELKSYTVRLQAPYSDEDETGLRSESKNIPTDAKIQDVLYSLNDNTERSNKTVNEFESAPDTLNKFLQYYMTHNVVSKEGGGSQTGDASIKEMLEGTVTENIRDILPNMIESQKSTLKNTGTITATLNAQLEQAQTDNDTFEQALSGSAKSNLIKELVKSPVRYKVGANGKLEPDKDEYMQGDSAGKTLQQLFDEGTLKESDFVIKAEVTPIITTAKETLDITKGQSVQSQLTSIVKNYADSLKVTTPDYDKLKPVVTVDTGSGTNPVVITISAEVKVDSENDWPQLEKGISMADYAQTLDMQVLVRIQSIRIQNCRLNFDDLGDAGKDLSEPKLYSSSSFTFKQNPVNTLREKLESVDQSVDETWDKSFGALLSEGDKTIMAIDMGEVLNAKLIRDVVNDAIQTPSEKLVDKMESLGKGDTTRAAFQKLADDFIYVDGKGSNLKLALANKEFDASKPNTANLTEIGSVNNKALELKINFYDILQDKTPLDKKPFEELVDLLVNLRDGVSEDIRKTSEDAAKTDKNKQEQAAKAVIADLIEGQIKRGKGSLTAYKWGQKLTNAELTTPKFATQRKEVATMVATLLMDSDIGDDSKDTMQSLWNEFEANGYRSVEFYFGLDANKRGGVSGIVESLTNALDKPSDKIDIGFKVEQAFD